MAQVSSFAAAESAVRETGRRLFQPFRFDRWLALGFVAFLDQCGRQGGGGNPGRFNSSSGRRGGDIGDVAGHIDRALAWLGDHVLLVAGLAAGFIALVLILSAVILWIQSRGTFMYLDNVATGRSDVRRPWSEHAERAGSYFVWQFSIGVAALLLFLVMFVPLGWSILALLRHASSGTSIAVLVGSGAAILLAALFFGLLSLAMHDFVAPLQWYADLSCGAALRLFLGHLREHPLAFFVYVLLKFVYGIVTAILAVIVTCLTCCIGCIPVVHHTLLQPLYYFDRRWSLEILHQLGYGPPPGTEIAP